MYMEVVHGVKSEAVEGDSVVTARKERDGVKLLTAAHKEIEYQRALHQRAQAGEERALEALYWSMLPLIKSRVRRVLERERRVVGEWYDSDDLVQDAYLVFHRFVMTCDPAIPLYRMLAGTFERSLRTYLRRYGPLHPQLQLVPEPAGGLEDALDPEKFVHDASGFERACARELLELLPSDIEREIVGMAVAGYTGREVAEKLGCSLPALRHRRRQMRRHLAIRGIVRGERRGAADTETREIAG